MTILRSAAKLAAGVSMLALTSSASWACACGCGVFEVGANELLPQTNGTSVFFEYDLADQNKNWSGTSSAPASANDDKRINTNFMTAGAQYLFDDGWGLTAEVPVWNRSFKTDTGGGDIQTFDNTALGDIRLKASYSGLFDDMSTTVIVGLKLPTGDFHAPNFDRDTEIGTGSTDLLLGLAHTGALGASGTWGWYSQVTWDKPLASQGGYTPGSGFDGAAGISYNGLVAGNGTQITPVLQLIGSSHIKDSGPESDPANTGYNRLLLSPGIEVAFDKWKLYGDVEFPVYQDVRGNQLVESQLFKFIVSYSVDG